MSREPTTLTPALARRRGRTRKPRPPTLVPRSALHSERSWLRRARRPSRPSWPSRPCRPCRRRCGSSRRANAPSECHACSSALVPSSLSRSRPVVLAAHAARLTIASPSPHLTCCRCAAAWPTSRSSARSACSRCARSRHQHLAHNPHLARLPGGYTLSQQPAVQPASLVLRMEPSPSPSPSKQALTKEQEASVFSNWEVIRGVNQQVGGARLLLTRGVRVRC